MTDDPNRYWTRTEIIASIRRWAVKHGGRPPTLRDWKPAGEDWPDATTVQHKFGSWNKGIIAAGFVPRTGYSVQEPTVKVRLNIGYSLHRAIAEAAEENQWTITEEVRRALNAAFPTG